VTIIDPSQQVSTCGAKSEEFQKKKHATTLIPQLLGRSPNSPSCAAGHQHLVSLFSFYIL
jgi:hypothetical protein